MARSTAAGCVSIDFRLATTAAWVTATNRGRALHITTPSVFYKTQLDRVESFLQY